MFFESRGENKIIAEDNRLQYIERKFKSYLADFILDYIADSSFECIVSTDYLLKQLSTLKKEFSILQSVDTMKMYILDEDEDNTLYILKELLTNSAVGLYRKDTYQIFKEDVIDSILEEINEHINDIKDVQSGKPIKRINMKKKHASMILKQQDDEWRREQEAAREALYDMYALGAFADE